MNRLLGSLALAGAALAGPLAAQAQTTGPISAAAIREDVRILSADDFQGRGPGERGETVTLAYLCAQFEAAGLIAGGPGGSWFQEVPLVKLERSDMAMSLTVDGQPLPLDMVRDWTLSGTHEGEARIADAPLVFAGFGISAPELGWDDYADIDLAGKVAVILPNDPDFAQEQGSFGGRQRSRYARGKAAAAFARGAVGVITIHREALTSWPWQQIVNSEPDATYRRQATPLPAGAPKPTAYMTDDASAALFSRAGLDLESLIVRAQQPGFRAVEIPAARISATVTTTGRPMISRNVIARLDGTTRARETVVLGAHWDAYGVGPADASGDTIRNGAVDNAIGTATLLEVARAFGRAPRPQRSVLFIGFTSEEDGLLGAYEYAAKPVRPLETTAAMFNLDPHLSLPQTRSVELIGAGLSELEDDLARHAAAQGRRIEPEVSPEAGWYQRSDHYVFAEAGVPTVYFRAGRDLTVGGSALGRKLVEDYNTQCYHQRCDEFDPGWDMAAAAQDGALVYALARDIADGGRWPGWRAGSQFMSARTKSAGARR